MEFWIALIRDQGGWVVSAALAIELARRVHKGDLVLGREYHRVNQEREAEAQKAELLAKEQREAAAAERMVLLDRIEAQSRHLDQALGRSEEVSR